jgi:dihydroxynaphthoic acid synthetase
MEYSDIIFDKKNDGSAWLWINRPKTYNAFRGPTLEQLIDAYQRIREDREIGVVVLSGMGEKAFCSGGDVSWEAQGGLADAGRLVLGLYDAMRDCLKPTIARVNGYSIGGGNHLAYMCDFTIASENATFGQNGPRVGSPASGYIVNYSARILGHKRAREMWLLCRRIPAQQALAWGLCNAVVLMEKLDEEVQRWVDEIMALCPTALKTVKASFDDEYRDLRDFFRDYLAEFNPNFLGSPEQLEGANAFLEKRPANYRKFPR